MTTWEEEKKESYKKNALVICYGGVIDFSPQSMKTVEHGQFKSYDEYLEIQKNSCLTKRSYFESCFYFSCINNFEGEVNKVDSKRKTVLFKRIRLTGTYYDGTCFEGKEDHVWISVSDTLPFVPNKSYSFEAEVYRYMKHGKKGKLIDYGLRNPVDIQEISDYEVPTDEELIDQEIRKMICDVCLYRDHCYGVYCMMNQEEYKEKFTFMKNCMLGKFEEPK